MRLLLNEIDDAPPTPPDGDPRAFHRRLPGYGVTPLVDATGIAADLGLGRVWVKDESSRLGLPAFKMLGASWATYRAVTRHLGVDPEPWATIDDLADHLKAPLRLAAATDGNHGRAVARMARLLGYAATIFVPDDMVAARIEGIESEGAQVVVVHGTYDEAVRRSAELASDTCLVISDTSWPGYTDVPGWVIDGYSTVFDEVDEQLAGQPPLDAVVVQMGVGALGAAVARHFRRPGRWLLGVEPHNAACVLASVAAGHATEVPGPHDSIMAGLNCGLPSLLALPVVQAGLDAFVTVEDDEARTAMRALAAAGVVSGETGAAGLAGLTAVLAHDAARRASGLGPASSVLVISTEGATDPVAYGRIVAA